MTAGEDILNSLQTKEKSKYWIVKLCNRNYKAHNGILSKFLKHLKRTHPDEYART